MIQIVIAHHQHPYRVEFACIHFIMGIETRSSEKKVKKKNHQEFLSITMWICDRNSTRDTINFFPAFNLTVKGQKKNRKKVKIKKSSIIPFINYVNLRQHTNWIEEPLNGRGAIYHCFLAFQKFYNQHFIICLIFAISNSITLKFVPP